MTDAAATIDAADPEAAELLQARRSAHAAMEALAASTYPGGNGGLIIDDVGRGIGRAVAIGMGITAVVTVALNLLWHRR